jgi:hypothetical protein
VLLLPELLLVLLEVLPLELPLLEVLLPEPLLLPPPPPQAASIRANAAIIRWRWAVCMDSLVE